ncbi:MAG: hypothetical protein IH600_09540 [Bacteroidetes bacterium]|nr:hypothetical protein [Bacteroidota bacterium]
MSNKISTILTTFFCIGIVLAVLCPTISHAQVTHLSGELCLSAQRDRYSQSGSFNDEQLLMQQYFLNVRGYAADPRFLTFDLTSSFLDYSSKVSMYNASSSVHRRDWGFWNANAVLFPNNGFRMTLSSKKNRIESRAESPLLISRGLTNPGVVDILGYGGEVYIPGNTIYPQISAGLNQETQVGEQLAYPVDQHTTHYDLKFSNANSESSQYNFVYQGYDIDDRVRSQHLTNHEFRLHGQSSLAPQFVVNANGLYAIRNEARNTALEVLADDLRDAAVQHRFRFSHLVNSYRSATLQRNTTDNISSMTFIRALDYLIIRAGGSFQMNSQEYGSNVLRGDEEKLSVESQYDRNFSATRVTMVIGSDFGLERNYNRNRSFVHSSRVGVGVVGNLFQTFTLTVRDDFNLQRQPVLGDAWGNSFLTEARWDILWRCNLNSRFNRTDTRNLSSQQLPRFANTMWENSITWNVGANTSVMANYTLRTSSSWYDDRSTRYMVGISQSELIPRLSLSFSADQTYSTYARQTVAHIETELLYRLYALSFVARYVRDIIGQYDRSRIQLEIRRPIDVSFQ